MKKILIITGSPETESNSSTMAQAFAKGINSKKFMTEIISVNNFLLEIYSYKTKTPDPKTEQKFLEICEKIKTYDGLVIATPTYNFGVPARLKNFIDRLGFIGLDYQKINKIGQPTGQFGHLKTFFLVSGGSPWWAQKIMFFMFPNLWLKMAFWYYGAKNQGSIYGAKLTFRNPAKNNQKLLDKCKKAGKHCYRN